MKASKTVKAFNFTPTRSNYKQSFILIFVQLHVLDVCAWSCWPTTEASSPSPAFRSQGPPGCPYQQPGNCLLYDAARQCTIHQLKSL